MFAADGHELILARSHELRRAVTDLGLRRMRLANAGKMRGIGGGGPRGTAE